MPRKKNALVTKDSKASMSNTLNEMFFEKIMSLQELRFFLVYLSKINPKKPEQTEVSYSLEEYSEILGVELNEKSIEKTTDELLRRIVVINDDHPPEGIAERKIKTQLFRTCTMERRKKDNKVILKFNCSDEVKPHIFELTDRFTSIEIWNVINLGNFQDARMYMLLRQYRTIGERTIPIEDLKEMLGIEPNAYPAYKIFARDVLKKCQKALEEYTDIKFEFNSVGRPAKFVHFTIYKNEDYKKPKFLEAQEKEQDLDQVSLFDGVPEEPAAPEDPLRFVASALPPEFTRAEVEELIELALPHMPYEGIHNTYDRDLWLYHFFKKKTLYMKTQKIRTTKIAWMRAAVAKNFGPE